MANPIPVLPLVAIPIAGGLGLYFAGKGMREMEKTMMWIVIGLGLFLAFIYFTKE